MWARVLGVLLQSGIVPRGSRETVFNQIYTVFLVLGTLVGIVVIGYMLWKAYKYRASAVPDDGEEDRPSLGELPSGSGGGRKLFLSFALSTIIVVSLIVWTYGTLLYVEQDAVTGDATENMEIQVEGYQFGWGFIYPSGVVTNGTLRVPKGTEIRLRVTSTDVFHNFGIPALKVKTDAIPGQTTETWFIADETGTYRAQCYELCGAGHSYMNAKVIVMERSAWQDWHQNAVAKMNNSSSGGGGNSSTGGGNSSTGGSHSMGVGA